MTKRGSRAKAQDKYEELRKEILAKDAKKTYYINKKTDEIIHKVTVHLPIEMVTRLKKEAIDRRVSLSTLIREKLK